VSALHHNGTRLYKLARAGIEVERQPREIEIFQIKLIKFDSPLLEIEVYCQSGTYIRTLADDIGREYGCGAYLTGLERISSNEAFVLGDAIAVETLEESNVIPLGYPLAHLIERRLEADTTKKYLQGQPFLTENPFQDEFCRVYDENGKLLGIGK